jgi:hypothetical protein
LRQRQSRKVPTGSGEALHETGANKIRGCNAARVSRVGLLRDASAPLQPKVLTDTETAAAALGLTFRVLDVRELQELDGVFAGLSKERVTGSLSGERHSSFLTGAESTNSR